MSSVTSPFYSLMDRVCAICITEVKKGLAPKIKCGHIFHRSCIEQWGQQMCPTCRAPHKVTLKVPIIKPENGAGEDSELAAILLQIEEYEKYQWW